MSRGKEYVSDKQEDIVRQAVKHAEDIGHLPERDKNIIIAMMADGTTPKEMALIFTRLRQVLDGKTVQKWEERVGLGISQTTQFSTEKYMFPEAGSGGVVIETSEFWERQKDGAVNIASNAAKAAGKGAVAVGKGALKLVKNIAKR